MKIKLNTMLITCGLALGIASAPSLAQVAPPPTKPAKEQPVYTPPAKPTPKPAAKPAAPQAKPNSMSGGKRGQGGISQLPTNVPYPKLAQPGPDGRILRLRQLPDIAALRSNHTIGPLSVEKIMPIVYARRYRLELMVIDNLDLYWELTGGLIENFDMSNIAEMGRTAEMLKPLVPETTLSQQLLNQGILTRVQGGMNQHIVREYKKEITDEIQVLDGESGLEEVMRFVLDDSIHEARIAYLGLLAEGISQIGGLIEEFGATSAAAQVVSTFEKPLSTTPNQQYIDIADFDKAFRTLPLEEAMGILQTMRERREFPEISPTVANINVLHSGKTIMEGDGFGAIMKDSKGRVINNNMPSSETTDTNTED